MNLARQLKHITTSIKIGGYDVSEMIVKVDQAIQTTREFTFTYQATSVYPQFKEHMKVYRSLGKSNKARVIATLEDVRSELTRKKPNNTYMLAILHRVIDSNFYIDNLQSKMLVNRVLQGKTTTENQILEVI